MFWDQNSLLQASNYRHFASQMALDHQVATIRLELPGQLPDC